MSEGGAADLGCSCGETDGLRWPVESKGTREERSGPKKIEAQNCDEVLSARQSIGQGPPCG